MEIDPEKLKEIFTHFLRNLQDAERESLAHSLVFAAVKKMPEVKVDLESLLSEARELPQLKSFLHKKYDKPLDGILKQVDLSATNQELLAFLKHWKADKEVPN